MILDLLAVVGGRAGGWVNDTAGTELGRVGSAGGDRAGGGLAFVGDLIAAE